MSSDDLQPGTLWVAKENRYRVGGVLFDHSACFQTFRGFSAQLFQGEWFILLSWEIVKPTHGRTLVFQCWSLSHKRVVWMQASDFSYLEQVT